MSRELICTWLSIPAQPWPPDPFILLGLPPGETDRARIERHVHQRMECVRRYQLAHPEAATEVMNRLAQAFNDLCATPPAPVEIGPPTLPAPAAATPQAEESPTIAVIEPPPVPPPARDPVYESACAPAARRGLTTKGAIFQRISSTRRLIRAWVQVGRYLADTETTLQSHGQAFDLARQLTLIRQELLNFPPLVCQAGQPGYYVIALARQPRIVQTFQELSSSERERLRHDWGAGLEFLAAHKLYLRDEISTLRRQSWPSRLARATQEFFTDYPVVWLILLGLLALNIAHPPLRADWVRQLLILGGGVTAWVVFQTYREWVRRASLHRRRRKRTLDSR